MLNGLLLLADNPASLRRLELNVPLVLLQLDILMPRRTQRLRLVGYRPWRKPIPRHSTNVNVLSEYSRHDHVFSITTIAILVDFVLLIYFFF